jgi:precorrin-2/cobalt-factor-2 C20-methyltransferase
MTVKGAAALSRCNHVFVPISEAKQDSLALDIARRFVGPGARIHELLFPMTVDKDALRDHWTKAAGSVMEVLKTGADACFLTLGDALLYSTYIYLLRELKAAAPELNVVTIPGITSFSAAAALTDFPLGVGKEPVTLVPASDDPESVRRALQKGGTVILMKIGRRMADILEILEDGGCIDRAVFVSRAGLQDQRIETNLRALKTAGARAGYLSVILVHAGERSFQ